MKRVCNYNIYTNTINIYFIFSPFFKNISVSLIFSNLSKKYVKFFHKRINIPKFFWFFPKSSHHKDNCGAGVFHNLFIKLATMFYDFISKQKKIRKLVCGYCENEVINFLHKKMYKKWAIGERKTRSFYTKYTYIHILYTIYKYKRKNIVTFFIFNKYYSFKFFYIYAIFFTAITFIFIYGILIIFFFFFFGVFVFFSF